MGGARRRGGRRPVPRRGDTHRQRAGFHTAVGGDADTGKRSTFGHLVERGAGDRCSAPTGGCGNGTNLSCTGCSPLSFAFQARWRTSPSMPTQRCWPACSVPTSPPQRAHSCRIRPAAAWCCRRASGRAPEPPPSAMPCRSIPAACASAWREVATPRWLLAGRHRIDGSVPGADDLVSAVVRPPDLAT